MLKRKSRIVSVFVIIIVLGFLIPTVIFSHSGGTDWKGGHHNGNDYHYHHGRPAHDHEDLDGDGELDCPYDFKDKTKDSSSKKGDALITAISASVIVVIYLVYLIIANDWITELFDKIKTCRRKKNKAQINKQSTLRLESTQKRCTYVDRPISTPEQSLLAAIKLVYISLCVHIERFPLDDDSNIAALPAVICDYYIFMTLLVRYTCRSRRKNLKVINLLKSTFYEYAQSAVEQRHSISKSFFDEIYQDRISAYKSTFNKDVNDSDIEKLICEKFSIMSQYGIIMKKYIPYGKIPEIFFKLFKTDLYTKKAMAVWREFKARNSKGIERVREYIKICEEKM